MSGGAFWQALGWLALGLNVWGNLELTGKTTRGWIVRLACNVCWVPYSVVTGAWALLANHVLFAAINIYGWRKWTRHRPCPAGECPTCERPWRLAEPKAGS